MGKKNLIVVGVGLVILIITAGAAYQNYEYAKQAREEVKVLNVIIQQKDIKMAKLTKEIKAKQDELSMVRTELDSIKIALNDAKTQINKVPGQPVIQVPKTVNK
jgi:septal ring factor EnvC (AmiA/AmiB activator)